MASENRFVYNPSTVDIKRSKFNMNSFWKGSIYHGDLVPVEITRIMPGDSAKYNLSCFIRTATPPIFPIMDTIRLSFAAFYVPDRLVWFKTKQFYGENTEGYGIQSEVLAPRSTNAACLVQQQDAAGSRVRSIGSYLGLVRQKNGSLVSPSPISLNPLRAYLQVYNDWFRNENFMAPYLWDHNQTGDASREIATLNGNTIYSITDVPKVCKQLDRYTSCLPWAQKGSPVLIGMSDFAPVYTGDLVPGVEETTALSGKAYKSKMPGLKYGSADNWSPPLTDTNYLIAANFGAGGTDQNEAMLISTSTSNSNTGYNNTKTGLTTVAPINLWADLSQATATSINEFRLAFATQRYLEALSRSGSKYREYIKGIFGVSIGDTTAQMAEYLGGMTIELNVDINIASF